MDPLLRRLLFGSTAVMAPPNDQGGGDQDDQDDDLDLDEDADPDDDLDLDADDGDQDDTDDQDDLDEEEPPPQRQTRGENRVAKATREAAEARREAAELKRRLEDMERKSAAPPQPRETVEQFRARLDSMDPVARVDYLRQLDREEMQQSLQQIRFESQDSADRTEFEALAARNPAAAKMKDDVEKALADMRRTGQTAPRKTILAYLIGQRALERAPRAKGKAERNAAASRDRHAARPGSGRGDAAAENRRGNDKAARDRRLENLEI
jgi:hypothetical protein